MNRILVPCNFSACCENAIRFAAEIAGRSGAEIILLTVVSEVEKTGLPDEKAAADASAEATEKFGQMMKNFPDLKRVRHQIRRGKRLPTILSCITREKINLVVMGTKGSRGWDQFFMGSNIEKVVRTSPVPVFAVKNPVSAHAIRNIVFPCNLKNNQLRLVSKIKDLQKLFNARLHILRVNLGKEDENAAIYDQLAAYALHHQLTNYTLHVRSHENEKDGIIQFSREINADMIAMATHGNRDLNKMYVESISADVVNHSSILTWTCSTGSKA
ncbi:universal stress protein [Dyadobacter bucti]|uniref:universal stress protein n=1 Tax=Dyadobacter bucti TaxID=2572203 RepID=UPI003F7016F3